MPTEHGTIDPQVEGTRSVHVIRGFADAADEAARTAISQLSADRGRVIEQTGGDVPGLYVPDGAGNWKRMNLSDAPSITEAITGNQDNWTPTGWEFLTVLRITADGNYNITGLVPSAGIRYIVNADTAETITLKNQDAASSAVNRFLILGGDLVLDPGAVVAVWYDTSTQRNRVGVPADYLAKSGGTMSGAIDMANNDVLGLKEAVYSGTVDKGSSSGAVTVDWTQGHRQKITLIGNVTLSFTDPSGTGNLILVVTQDGVGGHSIAFPGGTLFQSGDSTLTGSPSSIDVIAFFFDGTTYYASINKDFQ